MFKELRERWVNYQKYKILQKFQYNDAMRRQYYAELAYRTWVAGFLCGWAKGDPEAQWKEWATSLGIIWPMGQTYADMYKASQKKGE